MPMKFIRQLAHCSIIIMRPVVYKMQATLYPENISQDQSSRLNVAKFFQRPTCPGILSRPRVHCVSKNAFQFLEVMQQHVLGAMDNVVCCFVGNLMGISERIVKISRDLTKLSSQEGGAFLRHTVYCHLCQLLYLAEFEASYVPVVTRVHKLESLSGPWPRKLSIIKYCVIIVYYCIFCVTFCHVLE